LDFVAFDSSPFDSADFGPVAAGASLLPELKAPNFVGLPALLAVALLDGAGALFAGDGALRALLPKEL
jgi:hypothetical protein